MTEPVPDLTFTKTCAINKLIIFTLIGQKN